MKQLVLLILIGGATSSTFAQVVGYYNLGINPGDNLVANQLSQGGNSLDEVLTNGVLAGSTFSEWDATANQLLPKSVFDGSSWSINYDLAPNGVGGVLNSPAATTVTFVGGLVNFDIFTGTYEFVPPARGPGIYLLSLAAPLNDATFQQVVGRAPENNDQVSILNSLTQTYQTTVFGDGGWNNGTPLLGLGQSAYYGLDIPEPSTWTLAVTGATLMIYVRRGPRPGRTFPI